ncbi:conserved exported protein of unknown function [Acidithiobacillus ferrivorans]|uniref:Transglycosylase SLT domain-containing protein n=1 Tax=Acidithiobacillus ferrivorans TaxID=160808 RepID=A0A060UKI4_9PROT|nr:hypothetical protein [Acidithiobacillus ferrivorans]CDQ09192.1 conserved exported hypothetical protein [Acidithiobacillus ferrivorans]SMH64861.1 conserved exported protein of unknown function [Acidithiobacillus ferrivorans]
MRPFLLRMAMIFTFSGVTGIANAATLDSQQNGILKEAVKVGQQIGIGLNLAGVVFQESSFGLQPNSPGHFGVGSVGYLAWTTVIARHPWLKPYFKHKNWASTLISDPSISLWVAGYYLQYCRQRAANWRQALLMYRYGCPQDQGMYPTRVKHRIAQIHGLLKVDYQP